MNPFESAIVRIRDTTNAVVGTGFLVDDGLVCTCAHVVIDALEQPADNARLAQVPVGEVRLDFPFLGGAPRAGITEPDAWTPIGPDSGGDIAVIRLTQNAPPGAAPMRLLPPSDLGGYAFTAFGFPAGADEGRRSVGKLSGPVGNGLVQVDGSTTAGVRIRGGFSGAPVWADDVGGVVGMVVAYDSAADGVSLIVPNRAILAACSIKRRVPFLATEGRLSPRVFISHRCLEPDALRFLDGLRRELGRRGFDVALSPDRTADAQAWDTGLPTSIGLADACMLLLSPATLQPSALGRELALISGRCAAGDLSHFIPVLLGVSSNDVAASPLSDWEAAALLGAHQPIDAASAGAVDQIVQRLAPLLGGLRAQSALEQLESALVTKLQTVEQGSLENAAVALGVDRPVGTPERTLRAMVADALWHAQPEAWETTIRTLWDAPPNRADMARWTAPAWVDHHAARWIIEVGRSKSRRRFVVINGANAEFVSDTFIRRAYALKPDDYFVIPEQCNDTEMADVHVARIRSSLKQTLFGDPDYADEFFDEDLVDELRRVRTFVVLPGPFPDDKLLDSLMSKFPPELGFVIVSPGSTSRQLIAQDERIVLVRPPVESRQERRALQALNRLAPA